MKYLVFIFLNLLSVSLFGCSCFQETSFCNIIQDPYFTENGIVCVVESTGNIVDEDIGYGFGFAYADVKIVDLLFGDVHPGEGDYLNTDSTLWILGGPGSLCFESAYRFSNPGEQFVIASAYGDGFGYGGYSLYDCSHDVFRYRETMAGPIVNDNNFDSYPNYNFDVVTMSELPLLVNNCTSCMVSLNLSGSQDFPSVYRASSTIFSTAVIDDNIQYKANDRVTLSYGFKTNVLHNFKVEMDDCE